MRTFIVNTFGGGALYSYNGRKERSPVYILVKIS